MSHPKQRRIVRLTLLVLIMITVAMAIRLVTSVAKAGSAGALQIEPLIPRESPRADLISLGPLNGLGESIVTGEAGAALADGHVLLINLDTMHQDFVDVMADGSFQAKIFAPPGSNIMIKHGPDHEVWQNTDQGATLPGYNVFPSTTIYRPHTHTSGPDSLPFATAGAFEIDTSTPSSIGAGWSMTGTVSPVTDLHPGKTITLESTIRLYSQAIVSTTNVSSITMHVSEEVGWLMLFDGAGNPLPHMNQAGSIRLTPSGYPILDSSRPEFRSLLGWEPVTWQYIGGNIIEGNLTVSMTLSEETIPGIYRPVFNIDVTGVPTGTGWLAANSSWLSGLASYRFNSSGVGLPPLEVSSPVAMDTHLVNGGHNNHLIWTLMMDLSTLGTRGAGAIQDRGIFQPSSFVATQGAPYIVSPIDPYNGEPASYRLEPYLPMISYGRGPAPGPALIPFKLPGGQLCVTVSEPDGQVSDLGCQPFAQSVSGDRSTATGGKLNAGAIEVSEYYGLTTENEAFKVTFAKPGYHQIEMSGWVEDVWGNQYEGGGTYEVWVAQPMDFDPGILPGTPLAVGDAVNTTMQFQPRLPAYVNIVVRHFPNSDPNLMQVYATEGWANRFGYFASDDPPIRLYEPGEYRLDMFAEYHDPETGEMFAAAATWGSVVMTPDDDAQLVAHGRRGSDNFSAIPNRWFIFCDKNISPPLDPEGTPHLYNPYLNGDVLWSYDRFLNDIPGCLGDALLLNGSIQDKLGTVEIAIKERYSRTQQPTSPPGDFKQRVDKDSLPLFSSTTNGLPVSLFPGETDQIAYAYLSSQRPGVRVREAVAEDIEGSGYWRVDSMYDNQVGVGVQGDLPNDFKFQYVGAVYRDLESGLSEYLGQGSGWFHLTYSDTVGSRAMPPFSGPGNGGWSTEGGPLLTLKGEDIHLFIMPTGVRPGSILQVGDVFNFAGHLMPTLDSRVDIEVTSPTGAIYNVGGRANPIGYFYIPEDSFAVNEPGRWQVRVTAWHDGQIGSGESVNCDPANPFDPSLPCPSGNVLGSLDGVFSFYVVEPDSMRLQIATPPVGRLFFGEEVQPIEVNGPIPSGISNATVDYTLSIPGYILEEGQASIENDHFSLVFDPATLAKFFPNVDLIGAHGLFTGLADTFSFGLLLTGEFDGNKVLQATTLTIQGDIVYVEDGVDVDPFQHHIYLPLVLADQP